MCVNARSNQVNVLNIVDIPRNSDLNPPSSIALRDASNTHPIGAAKTPVFPSECQQGMSRPTRASGSLTALQPVVELPWPRCERRPDAGAEWRRKRRGTSNRSRDEAGAGRRCDPSGRQDLARQLRCSSSQLIRVDFLLTPRSRTKSCLRGPTRVPPRAASLHLYGDARFHRI
jgi:hypothetical protein